jgi:hypothetical protein
MLTQMTVWRALLEQLLYPYNLQQVQGFKPTESLARETLWLWFVQQCAEPLVSALCRWDKFWYGVINFHNHHQWADDNPHGVLQSRPQQQFSINVWVGIFGNCLIGPQFCHVDLQATTTEISCQIVSTICYKIYNWWSENARGSCVVVLQHISAMMCEMSTTMTIITMDR